MARAVGPHPVFVQQVYAAVQAVRQAELARMAKPPEPEPMAVRPRPFSTISIHWWSPERLPARSTPVYRYDYDEPI